MCLGRGEPPIAAVEAMAMTMTMAMAGVYRRIHSLPNIFRLVPDARPSEPMGADGVAIANTRLPPGMAYSVS